MTGLDLASKTGTQVVSQFEKWFIALAWAHA